MVRSRRPLSESHMERKATTLQILDEDSIHVVSRPDSKIDEAVTDSAMSTAEMRTEMNETVPNN